MWSKYPIPKDQLSSFPKPLFENEVTCEVFDMEINLSLFQTSNFSWEKTNSNKADLNYLDWMNGKAVSKSKFPAVLRGKHGFGVLTDSDAELFV